MLTDSGDLCLVVGETEIADPDLTGLEYRYLRRAVLDSPAQSKIVILDCEYIDTPAGRIKSNTLYWEGR